MLKMARFVTLNTLKTKSSETSAEGSIKTSVPHTPTAHHKLKSFEDLRLEILTIKGIFHSGRINAATKPRSLITTGVY